MAVGAASSTSERPSGSATPALAFEALFRDNLAFVWRVLRGLGAAPADVDDLCQEVFVVAHRKLPSFEGRSAVTTWLYGICWRVFKDRRRRAYVQRERLTDEPPEVPTEPDQLLAAESRQALDRLERILAGLGEEQRAVFVMYEIERVPMKEITAAMGCPLQTGYTRLHAARAYVRREWSRLEGGGPP